MPLFFSLMTEILLTNITHFPTYFNSRISQLNNLMKGDHCKSIKKIEKFVVLASLLNMVYK